LRSSITKQTLKNGFKSLRTAYLFTILQFPLKISCFSEITFDREKGKCDFNKKDTRRRLKLRQSHEVSYVIACFMPAGCFRAKGIGTALYNITELHPFTLAHYDSLADIMKLRLQRRHRNRP